jgi:hypothetical protein
MQKGSRVKLSVNIGHPRYPVGSMGVIVSMKPMSDPDVSTEERRWVDLDGKRILVRMDSDNYNTFWTEEHFELEPNLPSWW